MKENHLLNTRVRFGWTQQDVVAALATQEERLGRSTLGVDPEAVGRWERGEVEPSSFYKARLLLVYQVSRPEELGWKPSPNLVRTIAELKASLGLELSIGPVPSSFPQIERHSTEHPAVLESFARSRHVAQALPMSRNSSLPYHDRKELRCALEVFLSAQDARVFLVEGVRGSGKTVLCCNLVEALQPEVAVQMHLVHQMNPDSLDLAVLILRYAGIAATRDESLTKLSEMIRDCAKPWLVILDGVRDTAQWDAVGRQLDVILSYVMDQRLRFLVTQRSLLRIRIFEYPILNALVYAPKRSKPSDLPVSYHLGPWDEIEVREYWNAVKHVDAPSFSNLQPSLQQLIRTPFYLQLVHDAIVRSPTVDLGYEASPFEVIEKYVRGALESVTENVDAGIDALGIAAEATYGPDYQRHHDADIEISPQIQACIEADLLTITRETYRPLPTFSHEAFGEYALASAAIKHIIELGQLEAGVSLLKRIASAAELSETAAGVLDLVILGFAYRDVQFWRMILDRLNGERRDETAGILLSVVRLHTAGGRLLSSVDLEQMLDYPPEQSEYALIRVLLSRVDLLESVAPQVLVDWLLTLVRKYASDFLWEILVFLRRMARNERFVVCLLSSADPHHHEEARLLADLVPRIKEQSWVPARFSNLLRDHPDWQVRGALVAAAASMGDALVTEALLEHYTHVREDYKVRAVAARSAATRLSHRRLLQRLLQDPSWYVRNAVLEGVRSWPIVDIGALAEELARSEWEEAPFEVRINVWEIRFLLNAIPARQEDAYDQALFRLLRECRTGVRSYEKPTLDRLICLGRESRNKRVQVEAAFFPGCGWDLTALQAEFRRARGRRSVQIALDCSDLGQAVRIAQIADAAGADFLEVGDPLIKRYGASALAAVKDKVQTSRVVAEMMSADWGRDQVEMAAWNGADAILLIGPASISSIDRAVAMAKRLGLSLLLEVPHWQTSKEWCMSMQEIGVDAFVVTTNTDACMYGHYPLQRAALIRRWSALPVAVSGGFGELDLDKVADCADIVIVGRAVVDAVNFEAAARRICAKVKNTLDRKGAS